MGVTIIFLLLFAHWKLQEAFVFSCATSPYDDFKSTYCPSDGTSTNVSFFVGNLLITPFEILREPISKASGLYIATETIVTFFPVFETRAAYSRDASPPNERTFLNLLFLLVNLSSIGIISFGLGKLWQRRRIFKIIVCGYLLLASDLFLIGILILGFLYYLYDRFIVFSNR